MNDSAVAWIVGTVCFVLLGVFCVFGGMAGCGAVRDYGRTQKLKDAKNQTKIVHQQIQTAGQQAQIVHAQNARVRALAEQRVIEAEGIRKSQDLIAATLTPLYVQHEAIKSQMQAKDGDKIYIPVGPQGIPLVNDTSK